MKNKFKLASFFKTPKLVKLVFTLSLSLSIPLLVWGLLTQRFDLRKRAATAEPPPVPVECRSVGNIIRMGLSGSGKCSDLQAAINASSSYNSGWGTTIKFDPGTYFIPKSGGSFSINIIQKKDLKIIGETEGDNHLVKLVFDGHQGGINIEASEVEISGIGIEGETDNGLVNVIWPERLVIDNSVFKEKEGGAIRVKSGKNVYIYNSKIESRLMAITIDGVYNANIVGNDISNSAAGIGFFDSMGVIKYNLIQAVMEVGMSFISSHAGDYDALVENNTLINIGGTRNGAVEMVDFSESTASRLFFKRNLVVNSSIGINATNSPNIDLTFVQNDVWGNVTNYQGLKDQTGVGGNISQDPLWDESYCLLPDSPAIISLDEYMGRFGPCEAEVADIDNDGDVDIFDYGLLLRDFGMQGVTVADMDKDGDVDIFDYNILVRNFGRKTVNNGRFPILPELKAYIFNDANNNLKKDFGEGFVEGLNFEVSLACDSDNLGAFCYDDIHLIENTLEKSYVVFPGLKANEYSVWIRTGAGMWNTPGVSTIVKIGEVEFKEVFLPVSKFFYPPYPTITPRLTPIPGSERQACEADPYGTWKTFPDSCADSCWNDLIMGPRACLMVLTESCDCGQERC